MNPHDELQSLIDMFPDAEPLLADAEHVASQTLPEPYRRMLAHNHHMTVTMESHHGCPVDVRILDRRLDGDFYESTREGLNYLYDRLSIGGYVIIDDYGQDSWTYCRQAVDEFRAERHIEDPLVTVDSTCSYWRRCDIAAK